MYRDSRVSIGEAVYGRGRAGRGITGRGKDDLEKDVVPLLTSNVLAS